MRFRRGDVRSRRQNDFFTMILIRRFALVFWVGLFSPIATRAADDVRPVVDAAKVREEKPVEATLPTFFIVGDSTVKSAGQLGAYGWGERVAPYFDPKKINVVNHAIGGRSSRTFFTEGRWERTLAQMKAGDFVIIQFGHNDGGRIGDPTAKGRPSGRGTRHSRRLPDCASARKDPHRSSIPAHPPIPFGQTRHGHWPARACGSGSS